MNPKNGKNRNWKTYCIAASVLGLGVGLIGCEGGVGRILPSGRSIANTILTLQLGPVGRFVTSLNTRIRNVSDVKPFAERPTDNPTSGQLQLRSSSVTVLPAPTASGKGFANYQPTLSGTARLRVVLDEPGAPSPCDTGIDVGTFLVTVQNGVVTDISDDLTLNLGAVGFFLANNMSLCLELEADFPASITIDSIDVAFGPSNGSLRGTIELKNSGLGSVEIVGPGESPCTTAVLGPGGRRESVYTNLEPLQSLTFFAVGPDCSIIDSVTCSIVDRDRYVAIVTWSGTNLDCIQILPGVPLPPIIDEPPDDPPPPPETDEACCLPDPDGPEGAQYCLFFDPLICEFLEGLPLGPGTVCDNFVCEAAACCFTDPAECFDIRVEDCEAEGGDPQGAGVYCASDPCPEEDEACCLDDGTCMEGPQTACLFAGGMPQGMDTTCTTGLCSGACCLPNGTCVDTGPADCATRGGSFKGLGTTCSQGWCVGACCDQDHLCNHRTEQQCNDIGGIFRGERSVCGTDSCATVACCLPFIEAYRCFLRDRDECQRERGIEVGTGSCPAFCPVGACCMGGACTVTAVVGCLSPGVYQGDGTGCAGLNRDECPSEGACCFGDGTCRDLPATECASNGGNHRGDTTTCATPGVCPTVPTVGTLTGVVTDALDGMPIVRATVRVDRSPGVPVAVQTNVDGRYSLPFPDLPDFFALTASHQTHVPKTVNVNKAAAVASPQPVDFVLDSIMLGDVVIEAIPDVHHLGNDSFSGAVNSQFQKSAEGATFVRTFTVLAEQLPPAFGMASLSMLQKGTQCGNSIAINGTILGATLSGSPGDGSFGAFNTTFDIAILVAGSNTISITAADCGTGDIDDFEFVNAQIRLSP